MIWRFRTLPCKKLQPCTFAPRSSGVSSQTCRQRNTSNTIEYAAGTGLPRTGDPEYSYVVSYSAARAHRTSENGKASPSRVSRHAASAREPRHCGARRGRGGVRASRVALARRRAAAPARARGSQRKQPRRVIHISPQPEPKTIDSALKLSPRSEIHTRALAVRFDPQRRSGGFLASSLHERASTGSTQTETGPACRQTTGP